MIVSKINTGLEPTTGKYLPQNRISNLFLWRTHELFIGSSVKSRLWFNLSLPPLYISIQFGKELLPVPFDVGDERGLASNMQGSNHMYDCDLKNEVLPTFSTKTNEPMSQLVQAGFCFSLCWLPEKKFWTVLTWTALNLPIGFSLFTLKLCLCVKLLIRFGYWMTIF